MAAERSSTGATEMAPKSDLLSRLETFLPQMKASNEELEFKMAAEGRDKYIIEQEEEEPEQQPQQQEQENAEAVNDSKSIMDGSGAEVSASNRSQAETPMVEMRFALGVFNDEDGSGAAASSGVNGRSNGKDSQKVDGIFLPGRGADPGASEDVSLILPGARVEEDKTSRSNSTKKPLIEEIDP